MSDEKFFSKKGQRQIGSFIGQELLYDYLTDQLDAERKKAVQEFLNSNKEAQANMLKIQNGLAYAAKLAKTQVSEALVEKVTLPSKYSEVLLQKTRFNQWSPALKLGIEAAVVALGITIFAVLIPWHKLMDLQFGPKEVVLTEVDREYINKRAVLEIETSSKEEVTFPDEGAQSPVAIVAVAEKSGKEKEIPTTTSTTTTTMAVAKKNTQPLAENAGVSAVASAPEEKRQGELFRGKINVTNVSAISPKLVERVLALGARKAGQVELGWNKNGDSSYFHFTMPSSQYEELLSTFNEYGILEIQKEKHDRIMPQGILRIIITVDEKK